MRSIKAKLIATLLVAVFMFSTGCISLMKDPKNDKDWDDFVKYARSTDGVSADIAWWRIKRDKAGFQAWRRTWTWEEYNQLKEEASIPLREQLARDIEKSRKEQAQLELERAEAFAQGKSNYEFLMERGRKQKEQKVLSKEEMDKRIREDYNRRNGNGKFQNRYVIKMWDKHTCVPISAPDDYKPIDLHKDMRKSILSRLKKRWRQYADENVEIKIVKERDGTEKEIKIYPEEYEEQYTVGNWLITVAECSDGSCGITAANSGESVTMVNPLNGTPGITISRVCTENENCILTEIKTNFGKPKTQMANFGFFQFENRKWWWPDSGVYLMRFIGNGSGWRELADGPCDYFAMYLYDAKTVWINHPVYANGRNDEIEVIKFDTTGYDEVLKQYPELWPTTCDMSRAARDKWAPVPHNLGQYTSKHSPMFPVGWSMVKKQIYGKR